MSDTFDVVVVGAGPGGLAAAAAAADAGNSVCLVDDNPDCGGQIWRNNFRGHAGNDPVEQWLARFQQRVTIRSGWRTVDCGDDGNGPSGRRLRVERDGAFTDLRCRALILATGARELFLPFPGWTLPGVFGAGGLQAFVKSGLAIAGQRVVIAGTGPLLLAVAAGLRKAGARVVAIVEQAPLHRLAGFAAALAFGQAGKLIEGARYRWKTRGVSFCTASWVTAVEGEGRVQRVSISSGKRVRVIEADMLAAGYHLVPNTELPHLLGCALENGFVQVNEDQQTSIKDVYCVGEATGIGGVKKAQLEGRIAGLAAIDRAGEANRSKMLLRAQMGFVRRLASTFALRQELRHLASADTVVCRCEDVGHGTLRECRSWREAKLHTRCGMGPCQGRVCGPATEFLYGWKVPQVRPPVFAAGVSTLAGSDAGGPTERIPN